MPPGSPGIFRRKSSTGEMPPLRLIVTKENASLYREKMAASHTPWPNTKDDYELKDVIGSYFYTPKPSERIENLVKSEKNLKTVLCR